MEAGKLNQAIILQTRVAGKDELGGKTEVWGGDRTVRAQVRFANGKETIAGGFQQGTAVVSVRIRAGIPVDEDMRLWFRGRVYDIKQVLPGGHALEFVDLVAEHQRNNHD